MKMLNKLLKYPLIFRFWLYILSNIKIKLDEAIKEDSELYVVYLSHLNNDTYICKGGEKAIILFNQLNKINLLINRPYIKVFYGRVEAVFKYKLPKLLDVVFTFDATVEEQRSIYKYICDIPLLKEDKCQSK